MHVLPLQNQPEAAGEGGGSGSHSTPSKASVSRGHESDNCTLVFGDNLLEIVWFHFSSSTKGESFYGTVPMILGTKSLEMGRVIIELENGLNWLVLSPNSFTTAKKMQPFWLSPLCLLSPLLRKKLSNSNSEYVCPQKTRV